MSRRRASLLAALVSLSALVVGGRAAPAGAQSGDGGQAILFLIDRVSFEELLSAPTFRQLARAGGAALMTTRTEDGGAGSVLLNGTSERVGGRTSLLQRALTKGGRRLVVAVVEDTASIDRRDDLSASARGRLRRSAIAAGGAAIRRVLSSLPPRPTLVVVATPAPSTEMLGAGDEVTPLVVAKGLPSQLMPANGPLHTLASDTTRQEGLVSNVDVAPTVLRFFGLPIPAEMQGEPIQLADGPAPFALHRLHLEQRGTRLPIQFAELAFLVVAAVLGAAALAALGARRELGPGVRAGTRVLCVGAASLPVALLVAGTFPHRTYAWMIPAVLASMAVLTVLAIRRAGADSLQPFVLLAVVGLAILAVDAALGGPALRVPLFGGTMFDGTRFYGLPNGYTAVLLGSALFVAAAAPPFPGFAVVVAAGLFAGLPSLGANVGASITMFVAAGLWLVLRTRRRSRPAEVALVAGVAISGLAVVLLAGRFLPGAPTHATRFVERAEAEPGSALAVVTGRLSEGLRMVADVPAAVLPLIGFAAILVLVARRVGPVGRGMRADDRWRLFVLTLCVASLVAFVANDTGAAAADPAFIYAMVGIVYPAMLAGAGRSPDETTNEPRTVTEART